MEKSWEETPLLTRLVIILETQKIIDGEKDHHEAHEWAIRVADRIMEELY